MRRCDDAMVRRCDDAMEMTAEKDDKQGPGGKDEKDSGRSHQVAWRILRELRGPPVAPGAEAQMTLKYRGNARIFLFFDSVRAGRIQNRSRDIIDF